MAEEGGHSYHPGYGSVPTYDESTPPQYDNREFKETMENAPDGIRMNFVRKVYSILAAQMGLTTIVCALFFFNPTIRTFVQETPGLVIASSILSIGLLLALFVYRRSAPTNFYLLGAFTLTEAYTVATVCTFYDAILVLQAAILTFSLFFGLTFFTIQSKINFSGLAPFLFGALWIVVIASFVQLFLPFSRITDLIFAVIIAVLFCGYIVFDTYQLFNRFNPEEYILASIELYLDILNLFLAILRILGNSRD
ncbi:Transmembrane BAX inhibitor motif-containing protein 4 [Phlyctochytrium planicorne]|nr:Transmembrane BAX inhibitor motif-containing protein 4 [Phlyctochytrium planicorne]